MRARRHPFRNPRHDRRWCPDIVALFAQADERIVLFENDGKGISPDESGCLRGFRGLWLDVFTLADFNGDGKPDILYVNGDTSTTRACSTYHGIRILENDGQTTLPSATSFPLWSGPCVVADFDKDATSTFWRPANFADSSSTRSGGSCI